MWKHLWLIRKRKYALHDWSWKTPILIRALPFIVTFSRLTAKFSNFPKDSSACFQFYRQWTISVVAYTRAEPWNPSIKTSFAHFSTYLGRFVFAYDTSIALEGSNATFTCQDSERKLPFKVTWSFQGASVGRTLCENSSIAPGINIHKYQLLNSSTKLQVTDLNVNDTGNYTCRIKGENGETDLSATATLYVKGIFLFFYLSTWWYEYSFYSK